MGVNPPAPDESVSRWAVREAQRVTGLSNKAMAINAGVAQSALSDALNGKGRNLDTDWIIAQGDQFVLAYNRAIERRLGLSPRAAHEQDAERIGELVTLLLKARRPEVA